MSFSPRSTTDYVNRSSKKNYVRMNCFDRSSKRSQRYKSRRKVFAHRPYHLATRWKKNFFVGKPVKPRKLLAPALKPFRVRHVGKKKTENVAAHDSVDKSLCEERLLHLGIYFKHQTV